MILKYYIVCMFNINMDKFSNRLYLCVLNIPSLFLNRKSFYTLFIFLEHFYDISKVSAYSNFISSLYKIDFNICRKNNEFQIIIMVQRTIS